MRRLTKVLLVLASLAGALAVLTLVTSKVYRVPASSMEPTFHCARPGSGCTAGRMDRVLVSRVLYHLRDPHRGDIVAYKVPRQAAVQCGARPGGTFLHRIVGMPGERWREQGGFVFINGRKLDEPYVKSDRRDRETHPERAIPARSYVVLGDNRTGSCDSRRWGALPRDRMIGPVIAVYWPLKRISVR